MTRALFIIDVQNDFTEGGVLAVEGGAALAEAVTELLANHRGDYDLVAASRDWHSGDSDNGGHFAADTEPDFVATWPVHAVAGTPGAEYHPALDLDVIDVHIRKGQGVPAYSIYEGTDDAGASISEVLTAHGTTDIDVVGIAAEFCVRASALDALEHGQRVRVFTDLVVGLDPETSDTTLAELGHAGVVLTESTVLDEAAP